jgi:hypothetical protein
MSRGFTSIIWVWAADGETRKVCCIYDIGNALEDLSIGNALEDLSSSHIQQKEYIYDWVYDEIYRPYFSAYDRFLSADVLLYAPLDLQLSLSQISQYLDDLFDPEKEGFNRDIVERVEWNKIRSLSREALSQMEWEELITYHDDLFYL